MKNIVLLIIMAVSMSASCNSAKLNPQDAYIQLTKKRCFGKCPVYDLFIYKNGTVVYNGIANVSKTGKHQFKISRKKLIEIEQLFKDADYKSLKHRIDKKIRDLPITDLKYNGKKLSFQGQQIPEKVKKINSSTRNPDLKKGN